MLLNKKIEQARWLVLMLAVVVVVSILSGCVKKSETTQVLLSSSLLDNGVAATYKDGKVMQGELRKFINTILFIDPRQANFKDSSDFKEYMLKQLVLLRILNARASEQSKTAAEVKVKQQMDKVNKFDAQKKEQFDNNLKTVNLVVGDIEQYFQLSITALEDMSGKVTVQQVRDAYDQKLKDDPNAYTVGTVYQILIALKDPSDPSQIKDLRTKEEALKRAQEVKDKLTQGGDFAALAKEYSDDPGAKTNGGKYEKAELSQFVPELKKTALELPLDTISDPVATTLGYHILKMETRVTKAFEDVKGNIRSELGSGLIKNFMTKELPSYGYKSNLPIPSPAGVPTALPSKISAK